MKTVVYVLILLLVVVSSLVFARREIKMETPEKRDPKTGKAGIAKTVFKSADGGQTWQDISKGLPENYREDSSRGNSFFTNDNGLFLRVRNGLYHNTPNATAPFWTKEVLPGEHSSIAPGKPGISANNYWGVNLITKGGTSVWSPVFENFHEPRIRSTFETAGGTLFISIDRGIFRSADGGKTWKHVYAGVLVGHLAESDGILVSTSMKKIIRSTDDGENWAPATSEDGEAFDVKPFKSGFVAMTSTSASNPKGLLISYDGGKTWQSIYSGHQDQAVIDSIWRNWNDRPLLQAFMTSITQVGESIFCTHPDGIFRSSDNGKTWKLLLPSVEGMGFYLLVSGNVVYAIRSEGGC